MYYTLKYIYANDFLTLVHWKYCLLHLLSLAMESHGYRLAQDLISTAAENTYLEKKVKYLWPLEIDIHKHEIKIMFTLPP